jgi:hypothetical protein
MFDVGIIPAELEAILTRIEKPQGFENWRVEEQETWLHEHFQQWFDTLTPAEHEKLRPLITAFQQAEKAVFLHSLAEEVELEHKAELFAIGVMKKSKKRAKKEGTS